MSTGSDGQRVYAARLTEGAAQQATQERGRLEEIAGPGVADTWMDGLMDAIAGLRTYPERCGIAPENALFPNGTLRQLIYQRRRGGPTWRILFSVQEADTNDSATVWVHRIRHAARAPMAEWQEEA